MTNQSWYPLILVVLLAGCAVLFLKFPGQSSGAFGCPDCNVIVIGVDTLRADHIHALGYTRETTPNLDTLIARGYTFSNAIAPAGWTVPSFMSVMTGVFPSVHKVVNKFTVFTPTEKVISNLHTLAPTIETLAEQMQRAGYATGGFTGDAGVGKGFGYNQGFDVYTDEKPFGGLANSKGHALEWLDSLPKRKKFFMFYHGYDLHGQFPLPASEQLFVSSHYTGAYTGSAAEEARLREAQLSHPLQLSAEDQAFWTDLYDSKIHAADTELGAFLNELQSRGLLEKTVIVLVADHGEEWFEHSGIDHGHTLYDELIHVPLVVIIPGTQGGVRIPGQVSTMDIGKSILKITRVQSSAAYSKQTEGRPDLLRYLKNPSTPGYAVYGETDYRDFTHKRSVRTADGWKFIWTLESNKEELYDLNTDPGEHTNLIADNASHERVDTLRELLHTHLVEDLGFDPTAPVTTGCLPVYPTECI